MSGHMLFKQNGSWRVDNGPGNRVYHRVFLPLNTSTVKLAILSFASFWLFGLASCAQSSEQQAATTPPGIAADSAYQYKKADPAGTGKFYMGREIAQVMGHLGAEWLERPERVQEERTD